MKEDTTRSVFKKNLKSGKEEKIVKIKKLLKRSVHTYTLKKEVE